MRTHLLVIDPQKDFCHPDGSLFVPGADRDMERLARLVDRMRDRLHDIHITMDSHRKVDVAHPIWWRDRKGDHPAPFTMIDADDVEAGDWTTTQPGALARSLDYLRELRRRNRYQHVVWPYHCLIGDEGHNVMPVLADAVHAWEDRFAMADYVTKGSNPWTEHFSAVQAEVPDPQDPSTHLNTQLVRTLEQADVILLAGEARSHCVANTVRDIVSAFSSPDLVKKIVLLTDAMSDVPDPPGTTLFSDLGKALIRDLTAMGARTSTTTDWT